MGINLAARSAILLFSIFVLRPGKFKQGFRNSNISFLKNDRSLLQSTFSVRSYILAILYFIPFSMLGSTLDVSYNTYRLYYFISVSRFSLFLVLSLRFLIHTSQLSSMSCRENCTSRHKRSSLSVALPIPLFGQTYVDLTRGCNPEQE